MATMFASKSKAAIGSLLAASMLVTAMPASAQYRDGGRYDRNRDGISAGEVIAGAVVIGGLAAILSSSNGRYRDGYDGNRYDGRYNDGYDYRSQGNSRQAIERCVSAVERGGSRRTDVDVTRITDVDRIRGGYRIEGRLAVDYANRGRGYEGRGYEDRGRGYDDRGRGYDDRGRGYESRDRGYEGRGNEGRGYSRGGYDDRGSFTCTVAYGRVQDINVRGV